MVGLKCVGAFALGALVVSSWCCPAWADDASATDVAAARKLGVEGVKLANSGKCDQAIDRLSRAEKLFHAPTILGRLGECQVTLGKLVAGTESLQRVVREPLPAGAPAAFVAARARAQKVLDATVPRLARLTVQVQVPAGVPVSVRVDNEPLSEALLGVSHPVDPGDHSVEASAPDFLKATQRVTLAEGQSSTATLSLDPDPDAVQRRAEAQKVVLPPAPSPSGSSATRTTGWVTLGVGAAGVLVGTTLGALAMSRKSDLDGECPGQKCPSAYGSELDGARLDGTLSTVAFIAGGAGVAAGLTLLLWPGPTQGKTGTATVEPVIGLGVLGAQGTF